MGGYGIIITFVVIVASVLVLIKYEKSAQRAEGPEIICLGGVQYWERLNSEKNALAPKINPVTLTFERCN